MSIEPARERRPGPEPEVALVFSPEQWVETLHRHFADHGGVRVRQVVMDPALALEEAYDILVVSHRWPALTRAFVDALHGRRRRVLGVFEADEPVGREFLLSLDVDDVIDSGASMNEFVAAIVSLQAAIHHESGDETNGAPTTALPASATDELDSALIAVGGPPGGGTTEIAVELARTLHAGKTPVALVDADEVVPAVAQRLGLPIEPNLRTAIDAVEHGGGDVDTPVLAGPDGVHVLCGLPNVAAWSQVRPAEVIDVIRALCRGHRFVVADVANRLEDVGGGARSRYGISREVVARASVLVGVGQATPVGVTRLLAWVADVRVLNADAPVHLVVNRAPADAFVQAEITDEIRRTYPPASLTFVPHDRRVELAAWDGIAVARGPFVKAVAELTLLVAPVATPARTSRSRARLAARRAAVLGPQ